MKTRKKERAVAVLQAVLQKNRVLLASTVRKSRDDELGVGDVQLLGEFGGGVGGVGGGGDGVEHGDRHEGEDELRGVGEERERESCRGWRGEEEEGSRFLNPK
ncbi:hypothetical protein DEO72_LG4g1227 [Vigna unguiculata]|uniref:Uncharacterized protein n=1 Tax=Vigna unguiculata TaxID=3917 RepID=A0A4D6LN50_VIGUN|nr:hypothetical protein DEO72_LG4g1227 [Vigna unguiculata]